MAASAMRCFAAQAVMASSCVLGLVNVAYCANHTIPPTAQRGVLEVVAPPWVRIDGKVERLSPGSRIWGTHRMLVMSASLVGKSWSVRYIREPQGLIHEVWIVEDSAPDHGASTQQGELPLRPFTP